MARYLWPYLKSAEKRLVLERRKVKGKIITGIMYCIIACQLMVFGHIVLSPNPLPACVACEVKDKGEIKLRLEEADAIVELYEVKLYNMKLKAQQDDLRFKHIKECYEKAKQGSRDGYMPERSAREAKLAYDVFVLDDKKKDIAEAEAELRIAKARRKMVEAGIWPVYPRKD
jgi:hypothetical protein